jgi:hypothetical protein
MAQRVGEYIGGGQLVNGARDHAAVGGKMTTRKVGM